MAGPVVAAALIFPEDIYIKGLNDSKKLSPQKRSSLEKEIKEKALAFGIGMADVEEIARLNILQATFLAMKRAVHELSLVPDFILVDGRDFPRFADRKNGKIFPGRAVIGGDGKSASIAGASVLAKVHRDRLMVEYARQFPQYGFEQHKGYGTVLHRSKIQEFGPCAIHREKFIRKIMVRENEPAEF